MYVLQNFVLTRHFSTVLSLERSRPSTPRITHRARANWLVSTPILSSALVLSSSANSSDEARLDFSAHGFWQKGQKAFFDVRVFNPFAKSHLNQKLDTAFKSNENEKKRVYNQRVIEIEHGSFSPLVFTPYGGTGREAERFMTEVAQKLAERKNMTYNTIIHWLRSKLSFNLLKSDVSCLRESRRSKSVRQIKDSFCILII